MLSASHQRRPLSQSSSRYSRTPNFLPNLLQQVVVTDIPTHRLINTKIQEAAKSQSPWLLRSSWRDILPKNEDNSNSNKLYKQDSHWNSSDNLVFDYTKEKPKLRPKSLRFEKSAFTAAEFVLKAECNYETIKSLQYDPVPDPELDLTVSPGKTRFSVQTLKRSLEKIEIPETPKSPKALKLATNNTRVSKFSVMSNPYTSFVPPSIENPYASLQSEIERELKNEIFRRSQAQSSSDVTEELHKSSSDLAKVLNQPSNGSVKELDQPGSDFAKELDQVFGIEQSGEEVIGKETDEREIKPRESDFQEKKAQEKVLQENMPKESEPRDIKPRNIKPRDIKSREPKPKTESREAEPKTEIKEARSRESKPKEIKSESKSTRKSRAPTKSAHKYKHKREKAQLHSSSNDSMYKEPLMINTSSATRNKYSISPVSVYSSTFSPASRSSGGSYNSANAFTKSSRNFTDSPLKNVTASTFSRDMIRTIRSPEHHVAETIPNIEDVPIIERSSKSMRRSKAKTEIPKMAPAAVENTFAQTKLSPQTDNFSLAESYNEIDSAVINSGLPEPQIASENTTNLSEFPQGEETFNVSGRKEAFSFPQQQLVSQDISGSELSVGLAISKSDQNVPKAKRNVFSQIYRSKQNSIILPEPTPIDGRFANEPRYLSYYDKCLFEFLETEIIYVNNLKFIETSYINNLEQSCYMYILSEQEKVVLFGGVPELIDASSLFLNSMEEHIRYNLAGVDNSDSDSRASSDITSQIPLLNLIGGGSSSIFSTGNLKTSQNTQLKNAISALRSETFDIGSLLVDYFTNPRYNFVANYIRYTSSFKARQKLLKDKLKTSPDFRKWYEESLVFAKTTSSKSFDLESLLLEPVQRLTRYKLLVKSLIESGKDCPERIVKNLKTAKYAIDKNISTVNSSSKSGFKSIFKKRSDKSDKQSSRRSPSLRLKSPSTRIMSPALIKKQSSIKSQNSSASEISLPSTTTSSTSFNDEVPIIERPKDAATNLNQYGINQEQLQKVPEQRVTFVNYVLEFKGKFEKLKHLDAQVDSALIYFEKAIAQNKEICEQYTKTMKLNDESQVSRMDIEQMGKEYQEAEHQLLLLQKVEILIRNKVKAKIEHCQKDCNKVRILINEDRKGRLNYHKFKVLQEKNELMMVKNNKVDESSLLIQNCIRIENLLLSQLPSFNNFIAEFVDIVTANFLRIITEEWCADAKDRLAL